MSLDKLFYPQSIAIIGASEREDNLARIVLRNLKDYNFKGKVFAVGREEGEVYGYHIHTNILSLPQPIDFATIMTPAKIVPDTMELCAQAGVKAVHIATGGFGEYSEKSKALEDRILQIARDNRMRIIGPNCLGVVNNENGLVTPFVVLWRPPLGGVSIIAQSGGVGLCYVQGLHNNNVGINKFASVGNKLDVDEVDLLRYFIDDEGTKVIVMYLESIERGEEFLELAASTDKQIIIQKANCFPETSTMARSHTAAVSNDDDIFSAALRQYGVLRAYDLREVFDMVKLSLLPKFNGKKVGIISRSGGHAVIATDFIKKIGFEMPRFPEHIKKIASKSMMADILHLDNPMDLGTLFIPRMYTKILHESVKCGVFDLILYMISYNSEPEWESEFLDETAVKVMLERYDLPIVVGLIPFVRDYHSIAQKIPFPIFDDTEAAILAIKHIYDAGVAKRMLLKANPVDYSIDIKAANAILDELVENNLQPNLVDSIRIFEAYGIQFPSYEYAQTRDQVERCMSRLVPPLALKLVSRKLIHKTEVKGVKLGVHSLDEALDFWDEMQRTIPRNGNDDAFDGLLLQEMAGSDSLELIIGSKRDPYFGPVVMVGMGGIFVEALKDVAYGIAPLSEEYSRHLLEGLRSARLMEDFRDKKARDKASIAETMARLSWLLKNHPQITEAEINPYLSYSQGKGGLAVDARILLD